MAAIRVEREAGLVTVTIDRPEKKNAIDASAWNELDAVFAGLAIDPDARALILTGAGGNFSAGADLTGGKPGMGLTGRPLLPMVDEMRVVGEIVLRLARMPKPTLAKVDGVCIGVAMGLALACDLVLASDRARFSEIFAKRGLALDGGNSWLLPRRVGLHKAKELAFFGDVIDAKEAERIGLVSQVVPHESLLPTARALAGKIAANPPLALRYMKEGLRRAQSSDPHELGGWVSQTLATLFQTEDHREGVRAFLEKREPKYSGR